MTVELTLLVRVAFRGREVSGPRVRELLAALAADLPAGCGTDRLIEALWPEGPPEHPAKALQALVFRARAQVGPDVLVSTPRGYRLALTNDQVDATAARSSAARATRAAEAGNPAAALAEAEAGRALWAAEPPPPAPPGAAEGSGAPGDLWAAAEGGGAPGEVRAAAEGGGALGEVRAAAVPAYRALTRVRALSLARLGRHADAEPALAALARAHPRDEEVLAELLRCEAVGRGPAAALARYESYRRHLRDELGADPGLALQRVQRELLASGTPPSRRGVPHDPNPLLGRDEDVAAVTDLIHVARVTSIIGPGGLGKTRLAQAVARLAPQRAVLFVPLAGLTADHEVVGEVASALGLGDRGPGGDAPSGAGDLFGGLVDALGSTSTLLVLDNCEHVVTGVADLVASLLARSGDVRVLTTSRTPLGLSAETVYLLPELTPAASAALFRRRALAVRPGADLPDSAVNEVCRHLDGLPLAVELAAARIRVLSAGEIARRLDTRLGLRSGARDTPERHRTLGAVIDWSWHLLEPDGRTAMRTLSVFPDGFTADAAEHVLDVDDALPILEHLVDQSLLKVSDTPAGVRFRMLETVREFAALRSAGAGETGRATERFLSWARTVGRREFGEVFGPDFVECVLRVRADHDNLAVALRLAVEREDAQTVALCVAVLGGLWTIESNFARLTWLNGEPARILSHYRPEPELVEAVRTGALIITLTAFILAGVRVSRALLVVLRLRPAALDGEVGLVAAADAVLRAPDLDAVRAIGESGPPMLAAVAHSVLSYAAEAAGDPDTAFAAAHRTLDVLGETGNRWLRMVVHSRVGELELAAGNVEAARRHMSAVLPVLDDLGAYATAGRVRWSLVFIAVREGALDDAERWLEQLGDSGTDDPGGLQMFDVLVRAEILRGRGRTEDGLRLWREAGQRLRRDESQLLPVERPWIAEVVAGTVIAHAIDDRLDLVADLVADLPRRLLPMLTGIDPTPGLSYCGALLLAIALADLRTPGADAQTAARMVALAERFRITTGFTSPATLARARELAGPVYDPASESYTGLDQDALIAAASALVTARALITSPVSAGTRPATTGSRPA
ncbi:AfsR/SARP family transcriptional regulator [Cryptosporangium sp. NPDC051539]|uniref:AfsR/SARP family transcriptional regulator n=1 Tax=Cryptosporangium sp. NPDC051539 TaxID=3363962 RepID=UPI0037A7E74F